MSDPFWAWRANFRPPTLTRTARYTGSGSDLTRRIDEGARRGERVEHVSRDGDDAVFVIYAREGVRDEGVFDLIALGVVARDVAPATPVGVYMDRLLGEHSKRLMVHGVNTYAVGLSTDLTTPRGARFDPPGGYQPDARIAVRTAGELVAAIDRELLSPHTAPGPLALARPHVVARRRGIIRRRFEYQWRSNPFIGFALGAAVMHDMLTIEFGQWSDLPDSVNWTR